MAGISTKSGRWVRPVSDLPGGELKPCHYEIDGHSPDVLDVVRFSFKKRLKSPIHPENVLLTDDDWRRLDRLDPERASPWLKPHISTDPLLFGDGETYIDEDLAEGGMDESLLLVEPEGELQFRVRGFNGRSQARVIFHLDSERYDLPVTDIPVETKIRAAGVGHHTADDVGLPGGRALITVSLSEPYKGCCWKLASAMIFLP